MQELGIAVQIELIELRARYGFLMDELEENFSSDYLSWYGIKQRLSLQLIDDILVVLSAGNDDA